MKLDAKEQDKIRQYLLGHLPQEDSARLEEGLLSDRDFFEELLIVEDELIDQYLSGDLSQTEQPGFETHFLAAPERQQRVRFARCLKKYISKTTASKPQTDVGALDSAQLSTAAAKRSPRKRPLLSFLLPDNPILSYSLAAFVLLVAFGASLIAIKNWRNPSPQKPVSVLAVVLTPGLTREGGEIKKIHVPTGVDTLGLQLQIANGEYFAYLVELENPEAKILKQNNLKPQVVEGRKVVVFNVPAELLAPSDYKIKLSGITVRGDSEPVGGYYFQIVNK